MQGASNLREKNTKFHTYQLKTERILVIKICNPHHSLNHEDIIGVLEAEEYMVHNAANIRHWKTKDPLPLFFVNQKPIANSKLIY